MQEPSDPSGTPPARSKATRTLAPLTREDRLKAALKANMARRKAQARARSAPDPGAGGAGDAGGSHNNNMDE